MVLRYCRAMPPPTPMIRIKSTRPGFGPSGFKAAVVADVLDDALHHGTRVYAIAGLQGSGKSTLAAQVGMLARERGLRVATLSIDDVYLGRRERQRLARDVHPLLVTRGPPGTHDLALACDTLDALRSGAATRLPRFDKLGDRRLPPSRWRTARQVDLVLFDGWCLKVPAETSAQLRDPVNQLERDQDPDGIWRRWCNERLGDNYPALWARLDRLLWLQPPDFEPVAHWRWQQEQTTRAAHSGRIGMSRAQVERFVQHFERVSRQALRTLPAIVDRTLVLDARRRVRSERFVDAAG